MDVSPGVSGLKDGSSDVGGIMLSGAPSLVVRANLSCWMRAMLCLFDHELGYDEVGGRRYSP